MNLAPSDAKTLLMPHAPHTLATRLTSKSRSQETQKTNRVFTKRNICDFLPVFRVRGFISYGGTGGENAFGFGQKTGQFRVAFSLVPGYISAFSRAIFQE